MTKVSNFIQTMIHKIAFIISVIMSLALSSCDDGKSTCPVNPQDPTQYVIVGFWSASDCSGEPIAVNSFPVQSEASCYCWPGNSGENSADEFSCNSDEMSFTYTQYNSLICGAGDTTPTLKTVYVDQCKQDIPPTIYTKIIDYGACGL